MRIQTLLVLAALTGCAHGGGAAPRVASKPAPPAPSFAEAARPASGDLEVSVAELDPMGRIAEPKQTNVAIVVTNDTDRWAMMDDAHATVEVFSGAEPVEGCSGTTSLHGPSLLAPGETFRTNAAIPCAVPEPGAYSVVATVVTGEASNEGARAAASTRLTIDGELASLDSRVPPARVDVGSMGHPATQGSDLPS
jgi:hypothetical protein